MSVDQGFPAARDVRVGRGSSVRGVLRLVLVLALAPALGGALVACTSTPTSVDFQQSAGGHGAATVTVTEQVTSVLTTTATQTVTATPVTRTVTAPARTVTMTPAPATYVPLSPNTPPLPSIRIDLDRATADGAARAIVADVTAIDHLFAGSGDVATRLGLLDRDLATLASAGTPSGLDPASYVSRILSLRVFTSQSARDAGANRVAARSRWDVTRPQIGTLLAQVNLGLGTTYVLPAPTATTP